MWQVLSLAGEETLFLLSNKGDWGISKAEIKQMCIIKQMRKKEIKDFVAIFDLLRHSLV